jgi:hypothetical protein
VIIVIFILMFIGEGFDQSGIKPRERLSLLFCPGRLVIGLMLAWWTDRAG